MSRTIMCQFCDGFARTGYRNCQKCNYRFIPGLSLEAQKALSHLRQAKNLLCDDVKTHSELDIIIKRVSTPPQVVRAVEAQQDLATLQALQEKYKTPPIIELMDKIRTRMQS